MALLPAIYLVYGFIQLAKKREQHDKDGHNNVAKISF
jgi:hypothetical protein